MQKMKEAASEFLAHKRVAVTGVSSRNPQNHGSNVVYKRLRDRGYEVFAINPNANEVEGDPCYHELESVPGGVDWVVIGTRPETADATVHECVDLGIKRIWMHRAFGSGSVSEEAAEYGRQHGATVIDGGCPCMFEPTSDPGHRVMRVMCTLTGKVPRRVWRKADATRFAWTPPDPMPRHTVELGIAASVESNLLFGPRRHRG